MCPLFHLIDPPENLERPHKLGAQFLGGQVEWEVPGIEPDTIPRMDHRGRIAVTVCRFLLTMDARCSLMCALFHTSSMCWNPSSTTGAVVWPGDHSRGPLEGLNARRPAGRVTLRAVGRPGRGIKRHDLENLPTTTRMGMKPSEGGRSVTKSMDRWDQRR